jgi:tRNA 5-methylaminomethyl-2-thiouridine biosynthesis bifunctional protein
VVIDPNPGGGASGNPAALVSPRLDAGGGPLARLSAQAFARAASTYRAETPEAVIAEGALRPLDTPKEIARCERILASGLFRPDALRLLDAEEASSRLGEPAAAALWMDDALTVVPHLLMQNLLRGTVVNPQEPAESADIVCIAAGYDAQAWLPGGMLEAVAGQASWTDATALPGAAASWGGYAVLLQGGGVLFGATHTRGVAEPRITDEADRTNLDTLRARMPTLADRAGSGPLSARAAVRAATPDRLPLAGRLDDGRYVLGGLGGRGFTWAPLLAEHVAAIAVGAPSPLPRELADIVDPNRFARRARRRARSEGAV